MKRSTIQMLAIAAAGCFGSTAFADTATRVMQECMSETGAPGAYALTITNDVPQVTAAEGGTQAGAARVSDCVMDKYQVQFSLGEKFTANLIAVTPERLARCEALRRSISTSATGASRTSEATLRYQDCVAYGLSNETAGVVALDSCGRGSNVFQGGSSYCRD